MTDKYLVTSDSPQQLLWRGLNEIKKGMETTKNELKMLLANERVGVRLQRGKGVKSCVAGWVDLAKLSPYFSDSQFKLAQRKR